MSTRSDAPDQAPKSDPLYELTLLRDLELVNARVSRDLGPPPAGGLPVEPWRKPATPYRPLPPRRDLLQEMAQEMPPRHPPMAEPTHASAPHQVSAQDAVAATAPRHEPAAETAPAPSPRHEPAPETMQAHVPYREPVSETAPAHASMQEASQPPAPRHEPVAEVTPAPRHEPAPEAVQAQAPYREPVPETAPAPAHASMQEAPQPPAPRHEPVAEVTPAPRREPTPEAVQAQAPYREPVLETTPAPAPAPAPMPEAAPPRPQPAADIRPASQHPAPTPTASSGPAGASDRKQPVTRLNPQPVERYEVSMVIQGAPGPFADIGGWVQYELSGDDAAPDAFPQPLQALAPTKNLPLVFSKEREGVYTTEIAVDAFVDDADPAAIPARSWRMSLLNTRLRGRSIRFTPDLSLEELRAGRPKTRYFANRNYLAAELDNLHDSGESSPAKFDPEIQNELFAITLTPRRL